MDDGCFTLRSKGMQERTAGGSGRIEICVEAMGSDTRERLVEYLRDTYDLDVKLTSRGARKVSVLQFSTAGTVRFQQLIAPYAHPSMEYKLLPRFRGQFKVEAQFVDPQVGQPLAQTETAKVPTAGGVAPLQHLYAGTERRHP